MSDWTVTGQSTPPVRHAVRSGIPLVGGLVAALLGLALLVGAVPVGAATPTPDPSASASPASSPSPSAVPSPTPTPAPTPIITTRNVYRTGAAVRQYTSYWCVPASTQTMLNIILRSRPVDVTRTLQTELARVVGTHNRYRYSVPGNDIRGWAHALNLRLPATAGVMYRDRAFTTQKAGMWAIVDAIQQTGLPVGITVWHGRHARTVVGYRLSQMPGRPSTLKIVGFYVSGPLGSPRDPWPMKFQPLSTFTLAFSRYIEDRSRAPWHNAFVMVRPEPVTAAPGW